MDDHPQEPRDSDDFVQLGQAGRSSLFAEFVYFLRTKKKWWLIPILLALALISLVIVASGSGAFPFIYTL